MQPYVFVSHAAEDKRERVRPLVQSLIRHGLRVWIDRPGYGASHFGFDNAYIERHGILGITAGRDYRTEIQDALRNAGAVLVCLSRSLSLQRHVLVQELSFGAIQNKLVACIVDDVPYSEIPRDLGLTDAACLQADRVDPTQLAAALDHLEARAAAHPEQLPAAQREQWEIVTRIVAQIKRILPASADPAALAETRRQLAGFPIGPAVAFHEIAADIVTFLADRNIDPERNRQLVSQAMSLRLDCNGEGFTAMQIVVTPGEMLNPSRVTSEEFWTDVLARAGAKSRRTLAAVLLFPGIVRAAEMSADLKRIFDDFMSELQMPAPRGA